MAHDWAPDVKKYAPEADESAIKGIVRHCGIALQSRDASYVSCTDKAERDRALLAEQLGLLVEQLENAVTARNDILAMVSHDLKNWVGTIGIGVLVFVLWIAPDQLIPGYRQHWLFANPVVGSVRSSLHAGASEETAIVRQTPPPCKVK